MINPDLTSNCPTQSEPCFGARFRFGVVERLDFYPWQDLFQIAMNSAKALNIRIEDGKHIYELEYALAPKD